MPLLIDRRIPRGHIAQGYQKARRKRRRDSTLRPLTAPLNPDEIRVERAITTGIQNARARVKSESLREAIRMRSTDAIVASVPMEPLRGIMNPIDTVFRDRMVWSATKQGEAFNVRRAFSVVDPEVIRYAGLQAGALVTRMTQEQLASLRGAIVDAVAGQFTVDDTAKIIRSSIGLTDRYRKAVERRYRLVKQSLINTGQAERAAADAAERAASKYADRLVRSRARTIARTEINTAQNYGKQIGWEAAYGEGAMSPNTMKQWQIASGACDICAPYSGIRVPVMQPFPTGDLMPPAHPNCRCTANIVSPVRDLIQRLEAEDAAAATNRQETVAPQPTPTPTISTQRGFERGAYGELPKDQALDHYKKISLSPRPGDVIQRTEGQYIRSGQRRFDEIYATEGTTYVNGPVTVTVVDKIPKSALSTIFNNIDDLMERNPLPLVHVIVHHKSMTRFRLGKSDAIAEVGGVRIVTKPKSLRVPNPATVKRQIENEWFVPTYADDPVRHTFAHEWGHLLDKDKLERLVTSQRLLEMGVTNISRYGRTNQYETYAESYAEWFGTRGKTTNPFIKEMAERFKW